jgi:5-methylcytosine-specific restriction endonuclease McrA
MTNRTLTGQLFDIVTINVVWQKAKVVPGYDPNVFRKDSCGAWIKKGSYGNSSPLGWEIDHMKPLAKGGSDDLSNLQPLQWENNRHKGDNWPYWTCKLKAAA